MIFVTETPQPESLTTRPGNHFPLGATPETDGVNFALFSENATAVYLCLYDAENPAQETGCIKVEDRTEFVWHVFIENLQPGQLYGYRVDGHYDPQNGHLFNPNKLLLDPYAKAINAPVNNNDTQLGYNYRSELKDRVQEMSLEDSAPNTPKSVVISNYFDWQDDKAPAIPMSQTVIYEMHVKGLTWQHPTLDPKKKGTYAGIGAPETIDYLKNLGITAIELLPVHQFTNESYWGYNSIGFFAPQNTYAASGMNGEQVTEFKEMVKNLHKAGIEVILDVVYNHTAEGNQFGPTLSFKGIDNRSYYRLVAQNPEYFMDHTGTGNTFDTTQPRALQVVMDSLRYWATEMHVDGFRFDLASSLTRNEADMGRVSSFLDVVAQDPILAQVKLIAEPWDIGQYNVGGFPVRWAEWNGRYRDCVRAFWKGDDGKAQEMSCRLLGSPDLYANDGRGPTNSINFVIAHDGFTLHDLVSYNEKHNEANGEDNRDGSNDNLSWNHGAEGPTDDPAINKLREQQKRNYLTTLLLSQGTPMFMMGDEYGRTQKGNNNGYNQDSELSWFDWNWTKTQQQQFDFTSQLIALRNALPLLRRRYFYEHDQIAWLRNDGQYMTNDDWNNNNTRCLGLLIDGGKVDEKDLNGNVIGEESGQPERLLLIMNAFWEDLPFVLPSEGLTWQVLLDTATGEISANGIRDESKPDVQVQARSVVLLRAK
jgi:isoamylase